MQTPRRKSSPARWPFWLLIAAWICANTPQPALFATLSWLAEARHFTHQQRLSAQVAHLLGGEKMPERVDVAAGASDREPPPALPGDSTLKKIVLALESDGEVLTPAARLSGRNRLAVNWPDARREPPPEEPPRSKV
ncbi:MAG: hypothetical protein WCQ89_21775 [Verrucomicrobiota bacterium]